jgi:hypothetical protein
MTTLGVAAPFLLADPILTRYKDTHFAELRPSSSWPAFAERASERMLERSEVPIGELLPLLPNGPSVGIPVHQLSVRARNVLNRHGLSSWRALRSFTPGGLLQLPNVGMSTAREILAFALRFAGGTATPSEMWTLFELGQVEPMGDSHETSPQLAPRLSRIASELALLASWAVRERSVTEISELLSLPDSLQVPTTLRGSWAELRADLRDLADDELVQPTLGDLYKRLLDQLAESRRLVLEHRLLADSPMTLDELGTIRGVTREAVRQDEKRLKTQLATLLDNRTYLPFRWRAEDLANRLGVMAPTSADITVEAVEQALRDVPDDVKATVLNLLLRFAMPASYTVKNGWYIRGGPDRLPTSEMFWAHYAPASAVSLEDCREWLSEHSVEPRFLFEWVETVSGLRIEGDFVLRWENNVVDKCIAILEMTGKAATVDDLVERIGQGNNPRGVRDRLFQDPRVIRVDKYRFALREWGLEEYTGIAEEMAQRIAQAGGEADLNSIVKELVTTFGVAAGSVRAYADAPMFIRSGSRVRMRDSHESIPDSADLSACPGAGSATSLTSTAKYFAAVAGRSQKLSQSHFTSRRRILELSTQKAKTSRSHGRRARTWGQAWALLGQSSRMWGRGLVTSYFSSSTAREERSSTG